MCTVWKLQLNTRWGFSHKTFKYEVCTPNRKNNQSECHIQWIRWGLILTFVWYLCSLNFRLIGVMVSMLDLSWLNLLLILMRFSLVCHDISIASPAETMVLIMSSFCDYISFSTITQPRFTIFDPHINNGGYTHMSVFIHETITVANTSAMRNWFNNKSGLSCGEIY